MNSRITKKERGLIKGALRRVFSRSDLRKNALDNSKIAEYTNSKRPKVKTWCKCEMCGGMEAVSNMDVDHKDPVIPLHLSMDDLTLNELADRIWCDPSNLQILCESCHDDKTSRERKVRNQHKKEKKLNGQSSKITPLPTKKRSPRKSR